MKKEIKSYLVIDKTDFSQQIKDRIVIGNELSLRQITSREAFENFKTEISDWINFNLDLLKQSFDNPDNEYRHEYNRLSLPWSFFGLHSIAGDTELSKKIISRSVRGLEKILSKLDLIPVKGNV